MTIEPLVVSTFIDAQNPWPGLSSFDETAQNFFSGRDAESAELLRLVGQAPLTVLFGKSGLGKTSLVQAGLFPRLRQQNVLPVYVRLNVRDRSAPLIQQAAAALQAEIGKHGVDTVAPNAGESLWEHLHGRNVEWWSAKNQPLTPLFVFDQFEEAFTLGAENADAIEQLRLDLADLIENRIPADLAQRIEAGGLAEHLDLRGQRYKVLLSFREDFLPEVEGWKRELPSVMRNRLRLLPMSADRALQVVSGQTPTGKTHELVDNETAREIVRFIAAVQTRDEISVRGKNIRKAADSTWEKLEIEPALLSLLCEGLNEKRKARGQATIDAALLKETGEAIIGDFYQRCVADVPDKTRRFIEDALITEGGFRNSYPLQDALDKSQLSEPLLRQLVDRRLLRIDHQLGADRVELIHDRLTSVVREHRDKERERLKTRRQRRMWWATVCVVLSLISFGAYVVSLWHAAEIERRRADDEAKIALAAKADAEKATGLALTKADEAAKASGRALIAQQAAEARRQEAERQRTLAFGSQLAARAFLTRNELGDSLPASVLLAVESLHRRPSLEGEQVLREGLALLPAPLRLIEPSAPVLAAAASGPARTIAIASGDGSVGIWDDRTGTETARLPHEHPVTRIIFSPDGRLLATSSASGQVRVWEIASRRELTRITQRGLRALAFPETKTIMTVDENGSLRRWTLLDASQVVTSLDSGVGADALSADGRLVATARGDALRVVSIADGREVFKSTWSGGSAIRSVALSVNGRYLAAAGDGIIRGWELPGLRRPEPRQGLSIAHEGTARALAFSRDGRFMGAILGQGTAAVWSMTSGLEVARVSQEGRLNAVTFSDTDQLITAGSVIRIWQSLRNHEAAPLVGLGQRISLAPDGLYLGGMIIDRGSNTRVQIVSVPGGEKIEEQRLGGTMEFVALGPGAKHLAGVRENVQVYDRVQQRAPLKLSHPGKVSTVAFSPDGEALATVTEDRKLDTPTWEARLWDLRSGRELARFALESSSSGIALSVGGKHLAVAERDRGVKIWEIATRREVWRSAQLTVAGLALSGDGANLATVSGATVRVWELKRGEEVARITSSRSSTSQNLQSVAFTPDGKTLIAAYADGSVGTWPWRTAELLTEACNRLVRNLTFDEWKQHLNQEPYGKTCARLPTHPSVDATARSLASQGDLRGAAALLRRIAALDPGRDLDPEQQARRYAVLGTLERARRLAEQGRNPAAAEAYAEARRMDPALRAPDPIGEIRKIVGIVNIFETGNPDRNVETPQGGSLHRNYVAPCLSRARDMGLQSALAQALVVDSCVHGSFNIDRDQTTEELGGWPAHGVDEKLWIRTYIANRHKRLATHQNPTVQRSTFRIDAFKALVDDGNWDLVTPFTVRGVEIR
jgi:WD40 repeat protein